MFERAMNRWLFVVALPLELTVERAKWLRVTGVILMFPWFLLLALFGPITLGSAVILLLGCCIESTIEG